MYTVIANGFVISSEEAKIADIIIDNGKIVAISESYRTITENQVVELIDASGKIVFPGGIDAHTHIDMPFMGTFSTDDFKTGSIAALYGGTTSFIDYVIPSKNQSLSGALIDWKRKAEGKSYADYSFHIAIVPPVDNIINEFDLLAQKGIKSIKCFLAYKNALMLNEADLHKVFKAAHQAGLLVCIHAESGEEIELNTNELLSEGKTEPYCHAVSRPAELEGTAVASVIKIAEGMGIPIYFVHVSTADAMINIIEGRNAGNTIYAETCPQYLYLSENLYKEPNFEGAKYVMSPPLRSSEHLETLRASIEANYIDVVATDHCPFNFNKEKQIGLGNFSKIPNGIPGIELRMMLMFSLFKKNGWKLTDFVKINCTNPAKIFGLNNKGDIKTGYDADIVIWNPSVSQQISKKMLHENVDYTPFEGYEISGMPETVLLRGNIVIKDGKFICDAPIGICLTDQLS